ncbi:MAG TPA: hypothetical protein VG937_13020 [Polyangiaceae bacterium]|nr:hypothetical protein [Polyangiaceae bacterium]
MSKRVAWLCVAFTACSVYEPSLLGTGRNAQKGGATSAGGRSSGGFAEGGDAGEGTATGGSTRGGSVASGGTVDGGGAGGEPEGGSAETGGTASGGATGTGGGKSSAGSSSGGAATGGSTTGGKGSGGASSGGSLTGGSGGANSGGAATGGAAKGGATSGGALTGGTSSGGSGKGGSGGASGGGTLSTGGQSGGNGGSGGATGVLFSDNFETGNASAWTPSTSGDWSVVTDGTLVYRQNTVENSLRAVSVGSAAWQNQAVQARVKVLSFGGTSTSSSYFVGVYARYVDENNHYYIALRSDGRISIRRKVAGSNSSIGSAITPGDLITTGKWYTVKLEVSGTTLKAYIDGVLYDTVTDTSFASGKAGLGTNNASAVFDDFVVTSP